MGLDTSSRKLGWARGAPCDVPVADVLRLPAIVNGDWDPFIGAFDLFWDAQISGPGVSKIGYERPFFQAGKSDLGFFVECQNLIGMLRFRCWQNRVDLIPVSMATWRLKFLGVSAAPKGIKSSEDRTKWLKTRAVAMCHQRGWKKIVLNDEAEGAGVWNLVASEADPEHDAQNIASAPLFSA